MKMSTFFQPPLPPSLRAKYGTSELQNALHGSASVEAAVREIKFMFPNCKWSSQIQFFLWKTHYHTIFFLTMCPGCPLSAALIEPLPSREAIDEYLSTYVNPTLLRGLTEVCKHKPNNPCVSIRAAGYYNLYRWSNTINSVALNMLPYKCLESLSLKMLTLMYCFF